MLALSGISRPMQTTQPSSWHGTTILTVRKGGVVAIGGDGQVSIGQTIVKANAKKVRRLGKGDVIGGLDRKSTRLNSSHLVISYAVFCLKKKKNLTSPVRRITGMISNVLFERELEHTAAALPQIEGCTSDFWSITAAAC